MRYEQQVSVVCDACGSKGPTRREVAVIAGQEFGRVHHPSGWRAQLVRPSVQLAGPPAGGVDPFGPAPLVAAQIGQPVETLVCPACVRKAEAGARLVSLTGLASSEPADVDAAPDAGPEVDEPAVGDEVRVEVVS